MVSILAAFIFLFGLSIIDLLLTDRILKAGGFENNPLVRWIYGRYGVPGLFVLKIVVLVAFGVYCNYRLFDPVILWVPVGLYVLIDLFLGFQLRQQLRIQTKKSTSKNN